MKHMLLTLCLIAAAIVTPFCLFADEGSPVFFNEAFFTKPQSPDAWAMTRYGEASLDLFHGTIGLTVPVYTYQDKDFTLPVSLSYASSGFMPGASIGPAGLGWVLNAAGVITREVRRLAQEYMQVRLDTLTYEAHYQAIETQPDVFHFNFPWLIGLHSPYQ